MDFRRIRRTYQAKFGDRSYVVDATHKGKFEPLAHTSPFDSWRPLAGIPFRSYSHAMYVCEYDAIINGDT